MLIAFPQRVKAVLGPASGRWETNLFFKRVGIAQLSWCQPEANVPELLFPDPVEKLACLSVGHRCAALEQNNRRAIRSRSSLPDDPPVGLCGLHESGNLGARTFGDVAE